MKRNYLLLGFLLCQLFVFAQKQSYKTIDFIGEFIQINLSEIDHLQLKQSEKLQVVIQSEQLEQEATYLKVIKKDYGLILQSNKSKLFSKPLTACIEEPLLTSYIITVPKTVKLYIFIDSGNFLCTDFKGFLQLHVSNGEIVLNNCNGEMEIKNIDGIIQVHTTTNNITANSHLGKVFIKKKDTLKSNPNDLLRIETIRGNIFINTDKTP